MHKTTTHAIPTPPFPHSLPLPRRHCSLVHQQAHPRTPTHANIRPPAPFFLHCAPSSYAVYFRHCYVTYVLLACALAASPHSPHVSPFPAPLVYWATFISTFPFSLSITTITNTPAPAAPPRRHPFQPTRPLLSLMMMMMMMWALMSSDVGLTYWDKL